MSRLACVIFLFNLTPVRLKELYDIFRSDLTMTNDNSTEFLPYLLSIRRDDPNFIIAQPISPQLPDIVDDLNDFGSIEPAWGVRVPSGLPLDPMKEEWDTLALEKIERVTEIRILLSRC